MNDKYNGWTNYSTWRVNLEYFDGVTLDDLGIDGADSYTVGKALRSYMESLIDDSGSPDYVAALAHLALVGVDWEEIAEHMASWEAEA